MSHLQAGEDGLIIHCSEPDVLWPLVEHGYQVIPVGEEKFIIQLGDTTFFLMHRNLPLHLVWYLKLYYLGVPWYQIGCNKAERRVILDYLATSSRINNGDYLSPWRYGWT